jgi:hypothetical protein
VRYYEITVTDPSSGQVYQPSKTSGGFVKANQGATFTSFANNQNIPGALNIELDMPVVAFNAPQGNGLIRIWGVGLEMIGQAADLNGAKFTLSAGMKRGLPLANPAQSGLIVQGQIYQAFGNWQGINQTLDLIIQSSDLSPPNGISFSWDTDTDFKTALGAALSQAFPDYEQDIKVSDSLKPPFGQNQNGTYESLSQFCGYLIDLTQRAGQSVYGDTYPGVQITIVGDTIRVFDATQPPKAIQLAFQDLIGQPTWINPGQVSFKAVLRSDIGVGSQVKFPQGIFSPYVLTSAAAAAPNAPSRNRSVFQGAFIVSEVHHFANFRQPDADSWNTTFTAYPLPNLTTPDS